MGSYFGSFDAERDESRRQLERMLHEAKTNGLPTEHIRDLLRRLNRQKPFANYLL